MERSTTAIATAALLTAAACTSAGPSTVPVVTPASGVGRAPSPRSPALLTWTKDAQGKTETFVINQRGEILSRHEGVRIAAQGEVWDSEEGKTKILGEQAAILRARAAAALPGAEGFFGGDGKHPLELTEIVPAFAPDASLTVSARFTGGACYACSDGEWSSYSVSSLQALSAPPAALAAWATPPAPVSTFAREHPDVLVGGWSELPR